MTKEEKIAELTKLISPEGFKNEILHSDNIWRSDPELYEFICSKMNACSAQLIAAISNNASTGKLKQVLKQHLWSFRRIDYETEDAEFITECFELLAAIVGVKLGGALTRWLYGIVIWAMIAIKRMIKPEKVLNSKTQPCSTCGAELKIESKRFRDSIDSNWMIGRCMTCKAFNLLESLPNSGLTSFHNFFPEEYLTKTEFTEEQAIMRLEQVKHWRK